MSFVTVRKTHISTLPLKAGCVLMSIFAKFFNSSYSFTSIMTDISCSNEAINQSNTVAVAVAIDKLYR